MIKLADQDVKTATIIMFRYLKENMKTVRREIEDTKKKNKQTKPQQMELLEMKNMTPEMKNSLDGLTTG